MVKVTVNEPRLRRICFVDLLPGLNMIDDEKWAEISAHPIGASWIKKGLITGKMAVEKVVEPVVDPVVEKVVDPVVEKVVDPVVDPVVEDDDEPTAKELVEDMHLIFDMAKLRDFAADERKTVAAAAKKQISKIDAAAKDAK